MVDLSCRFENPAAHIISEYRKGRISNAGLRCDFGVFRKVINRFIYIWSVMNSYTPGLHIIGDLETEATLELSDVSLLRELINSLLNSNELVKVGEVYHTFPEAGYTATICLTESHISVHTWPEFGKVTYDVFLSNYMKNNDHKCRAIFQALADFFKSKSLIQTEIRR